MKEILIVEDDRDFGRGLGLALQNSDISCDICGSIGAAREQRAPVTGIAVRRRM